MNKLLSITCLLLLVFTIPFISSQEQEFKKPLILPNSYFYGLKTGLEKIALQFSFSPQAKATRYMFMAENRLSEMIEYNNMLVNRYQENIKMANNQINKTSDNMIQERIRERILEQTAEHIGMLEHESLVAPIQAQQAIQTAIQESKQGSQDAIIGLNKTEIDELVKDIPLNRRPNY